jgi:hypothetical protein
MRQRDLPLFLLTVAGVAPLMAQDLAPMPVAERAGLASKCRVTVTLQNRGPGPLPPEAETTARPIVEVYADGVRLGGFRNLSVPEIEQLRPSGGRATVAYHEWEIGGSVVLDAILDASNRLPETNEQNNSLTRAVTCAPAGPRPRAEPVAGAAQPRPAGGRTPVSQPRPTPNPIPLPDLVVTAFVLEPAPAPASLPDLAVTGLGYDKDCKLIATFRNVGPVEFPVSDDLLENPSVQLVRNGLPRGGRSPAGRRPGS